jgi:UPF0755 protein
MSALSRDAHHTVKIGFMRFSQLSRSRGISLIAIIFVTALLAALGAGAVYRWAQQPLSLALPAGEDSVDLVIPSGAGANSISKAISQASQGAAPEWLLILWLRATGKAGDLKAGSYEIVQGDSPRSLIDKIVSGKQSLRSVTLIEGWNWRQVRAALAKAPHLKNDSAKLTDAELMARLNRTSHPEGRFFPDTYRYAKGASDITVLRAAASALDKQLAAAWDARAANLPLQTPDDLLKLASIVEKETGAAQDRAEIAGVFINRLRINMRLQTDPTVIYGLGEAFDGNLRKRDLQTDTPYNSYTRAGLPPTPIAMPSAAALLAASQPAVSRALYFVARGDGTSQFSDTLEAHNRAVNKFIRGN